jgi:DNA-3-methyladenine glycosylase
MGNKLTRDFYNRDAHQVARELLGKVMVRKTSEGMVKGRIVEVEVYKGTENSVDYACHAFPMKCTNRTEIMFGEAGHAYIYLIYGMYCCINIVCNEEYVPECVLIRALEPVDGIALMRKRRKH